MQIKKLLSDEQAVSPVIGVILMVAITVILAAVIGTFVLGLGDQVQQTAPQVSLNGQQTTTAFTEDDSPVVVRFTHEGGDVIDGARLSISHDLPTDTGNTNGVGSWSTSVPTDVSSGDSLGVSFSPNNKISDGTTETLPTEGESVRVIWESQDGSSSQTLATLEVPSDIDITGTP